MDSLEQKVWRWSPLLCAWKMYGQKKWKYGRKHKFQQYFFWKTHKNTSFLSLFLLLSLSLTLHLRGRSYGRRSWATCHNLSPSGRGRTLFSGPGERRCAGWGLDSADPVGCDPVTHHFLPRNWSMTKGEVCQCRNREQKTQQSSLQREMSGLKPKVNCV